MRLSMVALFLLLSAVCAQTIAPSQAPSETTTVTPSGTTTVTPPTSWVSTTTPVSAPVTAPPTSCLLHGATCVSSTDCCSDRCVLETCRKSSSAYRTKLASGSHGGSASRSSLRKIHGPGWIPAILSSLLYHPVYKGECSTVWRNYQHTAVHSSNA